MSGSKDGRCEHDVGSVGMSGLKGGWCDHDVGSVGVSGSKDGRCDHDVGSVGTSGSKGGRCDHDAGSTGVSGSEGGRVDHDVHTPCVLSELRQTGSSKISVLCHGRLPPVICGSWRISTVLLCPQKGNSSKISTPHSLGNLVNQEVCLIIFSLLSFFSSLPLLPGIAPSISSLVLFFSLSFSFCFYMMHTKRALKGKCLAVG